jgi:hypothetical protein
MLEEEPDAALGQLSQDFPFIHVSGCSSPQWLFYILLFINLHSRSSLALPDGNWA